ncbi:MAG: hypothetical protein ACI4CT_05365 [Lachnospiraceae bacterium]
MKGFMLDSSGDIVVKNGDIQLVHDRELTAQTTKFVLQTNTGEWFLNDEEGIDVRSITVKNPNEDLIMDNIKLGLIQVDETFEISEFDFSVGKDRKSTINFTAETDDGEEVEIEIGGDD